METLLRKLRSDFPHLQFVVGSAASWAPSQATISYSNTNDNTATWGLLHELGHAELGHAQYESDAGLLRQEVAAWERATQFAAAYDIDIDDEYIERCLDSYRNWLHHRSECPQCGAHGLESSRGEYGCTNCGGHWKVSDNRFCRTYRLGAAAI